MLTPGMKKALRQVAFGVRKYNRSGDLPEGYFSEEDTTERVDGRSLEALNKRGLVEWGGYGGALHQIYLDLSPEGWKIFDSL